MDDPKNNDSKNEINSMEIDSADFRTPNKIKDSSTSFLSHPPPQLQRIIDANCIATCTSSACSYYLHGNENGEFTLQDNDNKQIVDKRANSSEINDLLADLEVEFINSSIDTADQDRDLRANKRIFRPVFSSLPVLQIDDDWDFTTPVRLAPKLRRFTKSN